MHDKRTKNVVQGETAVDGNGEQAVFNIHVLVFFVVAFFAI